ncbi:MAG: alpha/beta fold hydrolase [Rickettsiales bacterium]
MSTLLLSGWAQPADALASLAEDPVLFDYSEYTPAAAIAALAKLKPTHVVGWSLGGQLAMRAMTTGAIAPRHLTVLAAPQQFVSDDMALPGMGSTTYRLFRDSYTKDPARTKTRFHGLIAKGDVRERQIRELLRHHPNVEEIDRWLPWLEELETYSLPIAMLASAPPILIIHGMNDAIVPFAQSEHLVRQLPNATLNSWEGVGHAPHQHDAERARREIAAHRAKHGVA